MEKQALTIVSPTLAPLLLGICQCSALRGSFDGDNAVSMGETMVKAIDLLKKYLLFGLWGVVTRIPAYTEKGRAYA